MAGLSGRRAARDRPTTGDRLDALGDALRAGDGVLPETLVARAHAVESRAGHRLRLSADHTVVALAGSTGSGKSSLLNALAGEDLAEVDVLRPTTAEALAVVRGTEGSGPLLDWLDVRRRHELAEEPDAGGLVLLDLPDHDSVRTSHRLEAERLVALVDLMVWVVDPQKYADAAVHERYLRGLAGHGDVLLVVLNQVDRLTAAEQRACHDDLVRLLTEDGLAGVRVLDVSARTGQGVEELRAALDDAARRRDAARARLEADITAIAQDVEDHCGGSTDGRVPDAAHAELVAALEGAAGVPTVVDAVRRARVMRARQATGWPPTRWLARFRPDPLRRLHLERQPDGRVSAPTDDADLVRTSLPPAGAAERARARGAVRAYADAASTGLPETWALALRRRAEGTEEELADALDRAVGGTRLVGPRRPVWWGVVGALQWLLLAVLVGGLLWLAALAGLAALHLPVPDPPRWGEVPWPTLAVVGGALLGLVLAAVARLAAAVSGRRAARRAAAHLRTAVTAVADDVVVAPVHEVLDQRQRCLDAARRAGWNR